MIMKQNAHKKKLDIYQRFRDCLTFLSTRFTGHTGSLLQKEFSKNTFEEDGLSFNMLI